MPLRPHVFDDPAALGSAAAALVADRLEAAPDRFLLGCPGGRSAATTYLALAREVQRRRLDLGGLTVVMMDDYLVPDGAGGLRREDPAAAHSCERFAVEQIVRPLEAAAGPGRGFGPDALWLPDPVAPEEYDRRIADAGGIGLFLLASGAGDGHVAFNPPGSSAGSRTRVVALPATTRQDNLATFPSFGGDLDAVPGHGVTVGLRTIAESAEALMLVHGPDKGTAAERLLHADGYDPSWPATIVVECARPHLFLDRAAVDAATARRQH